MYTFIDAPPGGATNDSFDGELEMSTIQLDICAFQLEISAIK